MKASLRVTVLAVLFFGCATSGVNKGDFNFFSKSDDVKLGNDFAQEIAKQFPLLPDNAVREYFTTIGRRIAANSDWPGLTYYFEVVNTEDINAFAIPGGHIYLNRGLILAADNLSEVAGVLGHEISHVVARHGTEQLTKQYGFSIVAALVLGQNPKMWEELLANLFGSLSMLHYGRKAESEADELGFRYLTRTGYNPAGMSGFFGKLLAMQKKQPGNFEKLFATHPPTQERIDHVNGLIAQVPVNPDWIVDEPRFHEIQEKIKKYDVPKPKEKK